MSKKSSDNMVSFSSSDKSKDSGYRDYSRVAPPEGSGSPESRSSTVQTFACKLHYLLTFADMAGQGLNKVISWQPHGRCFQVHDNKTFVKQVLPNWFMQSKMASFQRQLNLYGFRRFTAGPDKGGYYHELFLRGRPDLAEHIRRTKVKGEGHRKAGEPEKEPNFYKDYPLPETPVVSLSSYSSQALQVMMAPPVPNPILPQPVLPVHAPMPLATSPPIVAATMPMALIPQQDTAKLESFEATDHDRHHPVPQQQPPLLFQNFDHTSQVNLTQNANFTLASPNMLPNPTTETSFIIPTTTAQPQTALAQLAPEMPMPHPEIQAPPTPKQYDASPYQGDMFQISNSLLALAPVEKQELPVPLRQSYHNECIITDALRAVAPFYPDLERNY